MSVISPCHLRHEVLRPSYVVCFETQWSLPSPCSASARQAVARLTPKAAALSVPTATVPRVESDDVVDPGDAAIQALLALTAENTDGDENREKPLDAILAIPPLTEWPPDSRETLLETCQYI